MNKKIGKIQSVTFGMGGYQEVQFGIWFTFGSDKESWGVGTGEGVWSTKRSADAKWTEESRIKQLGGIGMKICQWLKEAKVESVHQLEGIPVEVTFENNMIKDWRILTEVI